MCFSFQDGSSGHNQGSIFIGFLQDSIPGTFLLSINDALGLKKPTHAFESGSADLNPKLAPMRQDATLDLTRSKSQVSSRTRLNFATSPRVVDWYPDPLIRQERKYEARKWGWHPP